MEPLIKKTAFGRKYAPPPPEHLNDTYTTTMNVRQCVSANRQSTAAVLFQERSVRFAVLATTSEFVMYISEDIWPITPPPYPKIKTEWEITYRVVNTTTVVSTETAEAILSRYRRQCSGSQGSSIGTERLCYKHHPRELLSVCQRMCTKSLRFCTQTSRWENPKWMRFLRWIAWTQM